MPTFYQYPLCSNVYNEVNIEPLGAEAVTAFGITSGSLPPGMDLYLTPSFPTPQYLRIRGTCSVPGVYTCNIWYRQSAFVDYVTVEITINGGVLDLKSIPVIRYAETYYHILKIIAENRSQADFTVAIVSGTLPTGITFNGAVGNPTLIGETTEEGSFEITFSVTDNVFGCVAYQEYLFVVNRIYLNVNLPCTKPGLPYKYTLVAGGGIYPYRYHIKANYTMPSDLLLDTYTGLLQGSVYQEGVYVLGIRVFDGRNDYIDKDLTLICSKECLPTTFDWLPSAQSPPVVVGERYFQDNLKRFLPSIFEV